MAGSTDSLIELWPDGAPFAEGTTDEDRPALTPFLAENGGPGAVIVCPGGGYAGRADYEGDPIAQWLNTLGIHAFVLRYRVAPYRFPSALTDLQRAIRYVRHRAEEWGIDAAKVGVLGFSAGGHLCSTAGTHYDLGMPGAADPIDQQSCRPDLMALCYPVITMQPPYANQGSVHNLLGPEPEERMIKLLSNELQVTADTPPAFIWHTSDDEAVPVENCFLFASALRKSSVPFDLHVYEKGPHGLALAEQDEHVATWTTVCGLWLKRYGFTG